MFELTPFGYRRVSAYNPFRELEEMSHSFWNDADVSGFRTDIKKVDGSYVLEAELPGFKKEDIHVDIDSDRLVINAERHSNYEKKDSKGNFLRCERSYGTYSRSFSLEGIDADNISASYEDGVLKLSLPKQQPTKADTRRLEIQ